MIDRLVSWASGEPPRTPWPHRLGVLLVVTVFPLIWVGGLVTTTKAGMAVPDWPNTYGYNLFLYPWYDWFFGPWDLFVEHGHRLLATLSGLVSIVLFITCLAQRQPTWVSAFAGWLLVFIIAQGVLGGVRVVYSNELLALVHGCTGPLYFALTVAFCVSTSRWWQVEQTAPHVGPRRAGAMVCMAWTGLGLLVLQIVIGAVVRHFPADGKPTAFVHTVYLHLGLACVLVLMTWVQALTVVRWTARRAGLRGSSLWLVGLIALQALLGVATWVAKYGIPVWWADWTIAQGYLIPHQGFWQTVLITGHQATGSLILAVWTRQALRLARWRSTCFV